ncbi:MAG: phosphotransferase [Ramlibacter sp.]|nr:phosphotransferase [Ramlibacter sp.]
MTRLSSPLPAQINAQAFDAIHDDVDIWREWVSSIAAAYASAPVTPVAQGTVLVGLVGNESVVKLYPPFLRDHFAFEAAALERVHERLSIPTPRLIAQGERDGWPYLFMTQLAGQPLTGHWPGLSEQAKCEVLRAIGHVASEVHALPTGGLVELAPEWETFLQRQCVACRRRQAHTGLPSQLLAQLDSFLDGDVPHGVGVILTGEYTPMNLMYAGGLAGMFDFGDGLIGPAEYDWLGPLCFLAAGHRNRREAFFAGYGVQPDGAWRERLLRMLLLHRYSNLRAQIAVSGWDSARCFEELAAFIWP